MTHGLELPSLEKIVHSSGMLDDGQISELENGIHAGDPTLNWFFNRQPTTYPDGITLLDDVSAVLGQAEAASSDGWPEIVRRNATALAQAGLYPGVDFTVVPNVGRPRTAAQSAANATRHGAKGVEPATSAKSFAGTITFEQGYTATVVLTGPADLGFKTSGILPGQVGEIEPLDAEQLAESGFEHGTVNPVDAVSPSPFKPHYLFDTDFVNPDTRDPANKVYISAGDSGWQIALDIRKLITTAYMIAPARAVQDICTDRDVAEQRVFARRDITLISGDSAQVGSTYYAALERYVRQSLVEAGVYFGDASMPDMDLLSRREMGGTGDMEIHHAEIVHYIGKVLRGLPAGPRQRLVAFTSNAANLESVVEPVRQAVDDRKDLHVISAQEALIDYINEAQPPSVVVFGLPAVVDQQPDVIGETTIVKGRGKIAELMQTARSGSQEEVVSGANELKQLIARACKQEMAKQRGLQGREIGEFMKDQSIDIEGTVILAGTELWDILKTAGWQDAIPGLENVKLIDTIALLMRHVSAQALKI